MSSKIILYKGRRGCGKTLSMVREGYKYYLNGWRVLRNFDCSFGEYITEDEILSLDKNSSLFNCVIMIDEIQIFFDSRRSMRKENLSFSNFIQQVRKRDITILSTTQYTGTVDLRYRQHVDIIAYPNFIKGLDVCELIYLDITNIEDNSLFNQINPPIYVKLVYDAKPIFKLFNTHEMIR